MAATGCGDAPRLRRTVTARCEVAGVHRWANAPAGVGYLGLTHRHRFLIHASVTVQDADREIEFITLGQRVERFVRERYDSLPSGLVDFGGSSCEMIAEAILLDLALTRVSVSEDGEHSATVERLG